MWYCGVRDFMYMLLLWEDTNKTFGRSVLCRSMHSLESIPIPSIPIHLHHELTSYIQHHDKNFGLLKNVAFYFFFTIENDFNVLKFWGNITPFPNSQTNGSEVIGKLWSLSQWEFRRSMFLELLEMSPLWPLRANTFKVVQQYIKVLKLFALLISSAGQNCLLCKKKSSIFLTEDR